MSVIPTRVVEQTCPSAMSSRSLTSLAFSSLKVGKLTFTLKPLPVCPDWPLSWETLIWFECHKLCSLCPSKLSPPEEGEPPKGSLGTLGALCHLCLLWLWLPCCEWMLHQLALQSVSSFHFGSPSEAPSKPHIHSLTSLGHSWSPGVPCLSLWSPWPSGLCFLLYHSLDDGAVTFLHGFPQSFYLCGSPGPIEWAS